MKKSLSYFSKFEIALWISSVALIIVSFLAFDRTNYLTLVASLIGVTSLIFNAKGNPFGQVLMIDHIQPTLRNHILHLRLLRRDDHISRYDDADGSVRPDLLAAKFIQRQQSRGQGKQYLQGRTDIYVACDRRRNDCFLLHFGEFQHGKYYLKHHFGHDELSRRISDLPQKPVFCVGLRSKRYYSYCFVGVGGHNRCSLYLGRCLLRGIPVQRYLRLCQLAEDEEKTN